MYSGILVSYDSFKASPPLLRIVFLTSKVELTYDLLCISTEKCLFLANSTYLATLIIFNMFVSSSGLGEEVLSTRTIT